MSVSVVSAGPAAAPRERTYEELERIFAGVDAPFAFVDLDAMWSNAREMLARAAGTPIRVASKSVRCRSLLGAILEQPGFSGLMTFTLPESLWLHRHGFDDLLVAYPTVDRSAIAELARLDSERPPIAMVDSTEQLDYMEAAIGAGVAAGASIGGGAARRGRDRGGEPGGAAIGATRPRPEPRHAPPSARSASASSSTPAGGRSGDA